MSTGVRLYLAYGVVVLGLLGWAEYRGWSMLPTREERVGPRSVRDNPGAYRPIYVGTGRYTGGK
jgi:hypothetical protein